MTPNRADARVAVPEQVLDRLRCARPDRRPDRLCAEWADEAVRKIDGSAHAIVIPLGGACTNRADATLAARAVTEAIVDALRRRWSLHELKVEYGAVQVTQVASGKRTRTLLPHHDGGNCSYLTPSRRDVADWDVEDRRTFPPHVSTSRLHKLYQGFLVQRVGEADSVTPYYELLTMMTLAIRHQTRCAKPSLIELASACAGNLRRTIALLRDGGGGYVQLGTLLGASRPDHLLVNLHNTDEPFAAREMAQFPELASARSNGGDHEASPAQRLFEEMIFDTTGLEWRRVCLLAEQRVESRQYDLLFGHNILLMHGALNGGATRLLDPVYAVLDRPAGDAYENWLGEAWRTAYRRSVAALEAA